MKPLLQYSLLSITLLTASACGRPENSSAQPTANPQTAAAALHFHALVIGVSDYSGSDWPTLSTARDDADAIGSVLEDQYGFDVVKLLDRKASRKNILHALDELMTLGADDALLIYFAGHGFYDRQMDEGYWIPSGAARSSMGHPAKEDWLWNSSINRIISASPARHILLIADTCYGGSLFRGEETVARPVDWYRRAMAVPSRYLITSGNLEPVLDSGIHHSIFAREILNVLQYSDQNLFSASDLGVSIRDHVSQLTGQLVRMGPLPTPAHAGGEFVFIRNSADRDLQAKTDSSAQNQPVFRSAEPLEAVAEKSKLQTLADRMEKYSREAPDAPQIRPRILACIGPVGPNPAETTLIRSRLRKHLNAKGNCVLVEREAFDEVLREVELSQSSLADSRVATRIGKLLPASLILFGDILPLDGHSEIHLRVIDSETSRVLASAFQPFIDSSELDGACQALATEIMDAVNQARPLILPVQQTPSGTLQTGWGRFHGAQIGETFDIVIREGTETICPQEHVIGTARLLSMTEEHSVLKAQWDSASTNAPDTIWLKAADH